MRISLLILAALPVFAQCRLADPALDSMARMSPGELVDGGHFLLAAQLLEPVVRNNPGNGDAAWLLSRAKSFLGDLDEALKLAEAALATNEENASYHVQVAAVAGRMAQKASLLKQLSLARRVKKELDEAARLDPRNTDAQWGLMMFYYAAPSLLGGDKAKTEQISQELARAVPDAGLFYQGRLAREMKDSAKEEASYKQSLLINPLQYDSAEALMNLYMEKRDLVRAEVWACQAVHIDPTRGQGWSVLARVYAANACWTEASAVAEKFEQVNAKDLAPYYSVAVAAIERGEQLELAEQYLKKYVSKPAEGNEPGVAMGHWQLGLALERRGRTGEALAEVRTALQLDPSLEGAKGDLKRLGSPSQSGPKK